MIEENCVKKYCSDDISLIENYDTAVSDSARTWHCHHRLEISENKSRRQLITEHLYWNRPASELVFLTASEHHRLHATGKTHTLEAKLKCSAANKGKPKTTESKLKNRLAHLGKTLSMEARAKISASESGSKNHMFGKHHTAETISKLSYLARNRTPEHRAKLGAAHKGTRLSAEHKAKIGAALVGKHWYNDGSRNIFQKECPPGFSPGRLCSR